MYKDIAYYLLGGVVAIVLLLPTLISRLSQLRSSSGERSISPEADLSDHIAILHDLRNSITALSAGFELATKRGDADFTPLLELIETMAALLSFAERSATNTQLRPASVALGNIVKAWSAYALQCGMEIRWRPTLNEAPHRNLDQQVHGLIAELRRILGNLISNAIEHSPQCGPIDVGFDIKGGSIWLRVRNCGKNLCTLDESYLFAARPYRPTPTSDASHRPLCGIGLAKSLRLTHRIGAELIATGTNEGEELTFNLVIPIQEPSLSAACRGTSQSNNLHPYRELHGVTADKKDRGAE